MRRYWALTRAKIDGMSLRERVIIFVTATLVALVLINVTLLAPLQNKEKMLSVQMAQQQDKIKGLRAQMQSLSQARQNDAHSPLRSRLAQISQQLQEQDEYLRSRSSRLVEPDKMAGLLREVLSKHVGLQLVALETLPVSPLVEKRQTAGGAVQPAATTAGSGQTQPEQQNQIFKHGIKVTVRGGYLDLLQYLAALEKLPAQMFWGEVDLIVDKHPDAVLTLTLYTLSLGKIWLAI